ncbi:ankyrin [Apiospora aurea]|uniref:Ankyrin n=1 Tax=Apiospora aurea TaxID=335848 RepID=A0ABR1PX34_9PEZI
MVQLLDLPLDVFRLLISATVQRLGLIESLKLRFTCPGAARRGAALAAAVLLEFGADPDGTDSMPRSCLQNAARAGDAETVRLWVGAGAKGVASRWLRRRTEPGLEKTGKLRADALTEAGARRYADIVKILEEAEKREEKGLRDREGGGKKG